MPFFHLAETLLATPMVVVMGDKPGAFGAYRDGRNKNAACAAAFSCG